jgi:nicotinate phosphoribosyltransferase
MRGRRPDSDDENQRKREKIPTPFSNRVSSLYKDTNKAVADVITLDHEKIPEGSDYEIFDPQITWKRKKISNFYARNLRVQIFDKGKCVYQSPDIDEIRDYCKAQIDTLWEEILRFENPHEFYVDLSKELWEVKQKLIEEYQE